MSCCRWSGACGLRAIGPLCFLLLFVIPASVDADSQPFDYDRALELSQAALGNSLRQHDFIDVDGRRVSFDQFRGKPLVLSMVYTSCYQICPMTTRHLATVVDKARSALGDDSFRVALIGFDSAADTPEAMAFFAARQGIEERDWILLSASDDTVAALAADIGFRFVPSSNGFDHLIQATIIDAGGRVYRQVYGQVFDTPLLVDPLIELILGNAAPAQPPLANLIKRIKLFCTTYDPVRDGYFLDYSLFLGMLIGGGIILFTGVLVLRGLRHSG